MTTTYRESIIAAHRSTLEHARRVDAYRRRHDAPRRHVIDVYRDNGRRVATLARTTTGAVDTIGNGAVEPFTEHDAWNHLRGHAASLEHDGWVVEWFDHCFYAKRNGRAVLWVVRNELDEAMPWWRYFTN